MSSCVKWTCSAEATLTTSSNTIATQTLNEGIVLQSPYVALQTADSVLYPVLSMNFPHIS
jgi:hypothetical protein